MQEQLDRRTFLTMAGLSAAGLSLSRELHAQHRWQPSWNSLTMHSTPSWFQDAKFGIYFHWGIYSVPAFGNEWYSRDMYIDGTDCNKYHKFVYGPPSKFGYKDLIPLFHGEKFNPEEWAELFRKAGAKFAGPVAEHCDGFSMWNSKVNRWNAARMGPNRDVVGELSRAIRNEGLTFITTLHHQWLWGWYPTVDKSLDCSDPQYSGLYGPPAPGSPFKFSLDPQTLRQSLPPQEYQDNFVAKTREVIDQYHPSLLYFDSRLSIIDDRHLADLFSYYYNQAEDRGEEVSITYKDNDVPKGAGIFDVERGRLSDLSTFSWLTDDAIDWRSWSNIQNPDYKSADRIVDELVDIVSKNGCLLLDIPPSAEGVIPEPVVERLLDIGKWLEVNGEAIYGTRPWKIYGEGPTQISSGSFGEAKTTEYTAQDIRFTQRWKTLYATALDWPKGSNEFVIKALGTNRGLLSSGEIAHLSLLGSEATISWRQTADGLRITLPPVRPGNFAYVFKLLLN